ncbi:MAG: glycosyltransferase family 2 protein [Lachnospiraceae bacterium]|nr:glycosyltransferase family 2 protein [Lachnospiraceae bacterium]MBQ4068021.1 glycosyltransferase family 2 protein [Lachnospiraceae bacterium]
MEQVTVIIPNYNGIKFLEACLSSLSKQNYTDFKTVVIDNASEDGSQEYIRENYPDVEIVQMDKNYGFTGAVNEGIKRTKTPYLILLNNDTEVEPDFVEELYKAIEKSDDIFSVSSKMINYHNREDIDDAGDLYTVVGWQAQRGTGLDVEDYDKDCEVFTACAGAAIYRRDAFDIIGFFDDMHFAYLEDIDIGYRARIFGYKNMYCSKAVVYHIGSATSGTGYSDFKVKLSSRNNIYLIVKNMPVLQQGINFFPILAGHIVKYRHFKKIGFDKAYLEGIKEGILTSYKCKKVEYDKNNLLNYVNIELQLIKNTFIYVREHMLLKEKKNF